MEQKNLKRAQMIVDGIAWCRSALSYHEPYYQAFTLKLTKPQPGSSYPTTQDYHLSSAIRDQAFRMFRREMELKIAAYRREAAQIGLKLED